MALINCPECGKEISDKAANCPNCAFPLQGSKPDGIVRVKTPSRSLDGSVSLVGHGFGLGGGAKLTIVDQSSGKVIWEGRAGEVAEFYLPGKTELFVSTPKGLTTAWGDGKGIVDPSTSKRWAITWNPRFLKYSGTMTFQAVDLVDSTD